MKPKNPPKKQTKKEVKVEVKTITIEIMDNGNDYEVQYKKTPNINPIEFYGVICRLKDSIAVQLHKNFNQTK